MNDIIFNGDLRSGQRAERGTLPTEELSPISLIDWSDTLPQQCVSNPSLVIWRTWGIADFLAVVGTPA